MFVMNGEQPKSVLMLSAAVMSTFIITV